MGDVIIFLDDDVVLDKYYIYYVLKIFHENPGGIVGVMGRIKNPKDVKTHQKKTSFLYSLNRLLYKSFLLPHEEGNGTVQCFLESIPLLENAYTITVGIRNLDGQIDYDLWPNAARFTITTSQINETPYLLFDNCLVRVPSKIIYYH